MDSVILKHYLREDVQIEVSKFCRGRWVALEAKPYRDKRMFYRYLDDKPLTINEPADLKKIISKFSNKNIRTVYGTLNVYRKIDSREDVSSIENISRTTPSIDIDGSLEGIELTIEAVKTIVEELWQNNVEKSIYLIWSGKGVHVHINEKAVNDQYWKPNPVMTAHLVIEYILRKTKDKLLKIISKSSHSNIKLRIENIIDIQRVFTAPLSVHRELDIVTIPINPDEVENFNIEWARLNNFRYWEEWSRYVEGELDELVERALKEVKKDAVTKTVIGEEEKEAHELETPPKPIAQSIGRFQVMALLQAVRHYLLRGEIDQAKSFGLNRAIFYAWAKKRGITSKSSLGKLSLLEEAKRNEIIEKIGDEVVYRKPGGWYMIGGQEQSPRDFDRQIIHRFGGEESFRKYWDSALRYLQRFPLETLLSQKDFYEKIYLPVRDNVNKLLEE